MKVLQKVVIAAILVFGFTVLINAQTETRISKTWKVEKYDLTVNLPQSENDRNMTVAAVLNLKNASTSSATSLTLRISQYAEVISVKVNDAAAEFTKSEEKVNDSSSLQKIGIRLPSIQPGGVFTATVEYKLNIKENLGLGSLSPAGSHFLPLSFWYPTPNSWFFARGADYAPFNLNVVAPNGMTVLSSGVVTAGTFQQKLNGQPFFVADVWDTINSRNIAVFVPKGSAADERARAEEIAGFTADAKSYMEGLLGPMPEIPIRIVAVKRGAGFSGGGTIFVEDSLFRRKKMDSQTVMTVAEAVAKIWLGNAVLVDNDGYGVIREGLARYIATLFIEKEYGRDVADIERQRQRIAYSAVSKRDSPLKYASPLDDYYYASAANKGAMIWRLVGKKIGIGKMFEMMRAQMTDGAVELADFRQALNSEKSLLDYEIDEVLDMNLLVGLPLANPAGQKSALRNTGAIDVTVEVIATTSSGIKLKKEVTIPARGYSDVIFETREKIMQTEIDSEKLYPQTEYSDDIAPREFDESDPLVTIKRAFDKQDYSLAEKTARGAILNAPRFDDARTWLGRVFLAQNKITEADRVFKEVLEEKLPTARSLAWANVGLGEISLRSGQKAQAAKYFDDAIRADAEYGASLAARQGRNKSDFTGAIDESVRAFFTRFDKAAVSGSKAGLAELIVSGEVPRFAGGVAGAQTWQTKILQVDILDANTVLVETELAIRLLTKEAESGMAVFQLSRVGGSWKLSRVAMFEVR